MIQTASSEPIANNIGHILDICTALNEQIAELDSYLFDITKLMNSQLERVDSLRISMEFLEEQQGAHAVNREQISQMLVRIGSLESKVLEDTQ